MPRKYVLISVSSLVIFFIIAIIFFTRSNSANTYTVKASTLTDQIEVSGNYQIAAQTKVISPATGIITKIFAKNGDQVTKGAWLFYVQATATPADQATAFAAYQTAASAYQEALNNRRNTQATVDNVHDEVKGNSGDETFQQKADRTTAEVANDNAWDAIKTAQANLDSAQIAYQNTQSAYAVAPSSGTLVNFSANPGDAISGTVGYIADFNNPHVVVSVNEVNISKLSIGQRADITFDALPNQDFSGTITQIDDVGSQNQGETTYNTTLTLENPSQNLKPGMTANVTIQTLNLQNILVIPNSAITQKDGKNYVQKQADKSLTEVQIGAKTTTNSQITGGLLEGDKIIINNE